MERDLRSFGFRPISIEGHYGESEPSFLVPHSGSEEDQKKIEKLAFSPHYNQESVIHSHDHANLNRLVMQSGHEMKGSGVIHDHPDLTDYYSDIPNVGRIRLIINQPKEEDIKKSFFDSKEIKAIESRHLGHAKSRKAHHYGLVDGVNIFHAALPEHRAMMGKHVEDADDESLPKIISEAKDSDTPAVILHGSVPSSLREKAFAASHPHAYDWHDGHSNYHSDLEKADLPKEPAYGNEQVASKGVGTYHPIAKHFGTVTPGKKTHLVFYPHLDRAEGAVDGQVKEHGYQVYYAGGKYGKPDLATKNYNTGHLMIYDPTPQSGGDFGHEAYTRTWRKSHELAHALTYPELNQIYGEGRRIGKLGTRTPREAKRAIHWEWLAAHKQRDLLEKAGIKISDEDFAKELNTVMHDAVHRAVTGKFTEPSDEGFTPSATPVPLEKVFDLFKEHQRALGLDHDEATFATRPASSEYGVKKSMEGEPMAKGKKIEMPAKDLIEEHQKLIQILESPSHQDDLDEAKEQRKELAGYEAEAEKPETAEEIVGKIKELQAKLKAITGVTETISGKELIPGIENPQKECPACERPVESCICYENLPPPKVEIDGRKVKIFFKSEWNEEDRINFINDLKARAGKILLEQRREQAASALAEIRKKLS